MQKYFGIDLKTRMGPASSVPMELSGEAGTHIVMAAARRVMAEHADVLKALASR